MARGARRGRAQGAMPGAADNAGRDARLLATALGIDNLGSGMFLPLTLVYVTRGLGLPLGVAGGIVSAGALLGLAVPLLAGRLIDALGPRNIVIAAQGVQALGMVVYLIAHGPAMVFLAAALTLCGSQLFYSALFTLIGRVAPDGPKDHFFAVVDMVRSGCFGLGALLAGIALTVGGDPALRVLVIVNALSFLAGAIIGLGVTGGGRVRATASISTAITDSSSAGPSAETDPDGAGTPDPKLHGRPAPVWRNRPFLLLTAAVGLIMFAGDFFLVGLPVFALDQLHAPGWVPGVCVTILTVLLSTTMAAVVRRTRSLARTTVIALGALVVAVWGVLSPVALALPAGGAPFWLIGSTLIFAAGQLIIGTRANALAESLAPEGAKGRYLSFFQFAFSLASVLAPLLVGLLALSPILPWIVVTVVALAGGIGILLLARHLPASAVRPAP